MAENTPNRGYTYPEYTDPTNFPAQMQDLATDIDTDVQDLIDAAAAGRDRPGVRIFSNSTQAYAANTDTVVTLDLQSHNTGGMYNPANNSMLFPQEGLYVIGYDVQNADSAAQSGFSSWLHLVATGEVVSGFTHRSGTASQSPSFAEYILRYMNVGDELQVRFRAQLASSVFTARAYAAQITQNTPI